MERFVVVGGTPLRGTVRVSGAKNAVLPMLAASVLIDGECVIYDVPFLRDVEVMVEILRRMGVEVERFADRATGLSGLRICARELCTYEVPESLMREMRSSIFMMGPLLGRLRKVRVSYPGGCAIGPRPIDFHLKGLQLMGARIEEKYGYIFAETDGLVGTEIHLDFPSVGATENLMMAAVLARGTTTIRNAAKEPEIVDLQNFLNRAGGRIKGAGTDVIRIDGVDAVAGADHLVIPDRIEAATYMIMAVATRGELLLENVIPEHVEAVCAKLREAGAALETNENHIVVAAGSRSHAVDCKTLPYPGFPTDVQPQMMALMSVAEGTSVITETIFENRFSQAEELRRMGANIKTEGRTAVVKGVDSLSGASVEATDLRGGAALVTAGLVADGVTTIGGVHHLDRGYEVMETKLQSVGAAIKRTRPVEADVEIASS